MNTSTTNCTACIGQSSLHLRIFIFIFNYMYYHLQALINLNSTVKYPHPPPKNKPSVKKKYNNLKNHLYMFTNSTCTYYSGGSYTRSKVCNKPASFSDWIKPVSVKRKFCAIIYFENQALVTFTCANDIDHNLNHIAKLKFNSSNLQHRRKKILFALLIPEIHE